MSGMYMPMQGSTQSLRSVADITWLQAGTLNLMQRAEISLHRAYSDMFMRPLDPAISPMHVRNLADIRFWQTTQNWHLRYEHTHGRLHLHLTGSLFQYGIGDTLSYTPLRIYQETYGGGSHVQRRLGAYQVSLHGEGLCSHTVIPEWRLSYGTRAPTHTELYGYYLYVPMDNSIQMGSSTLRPERLLRAEASLRYVKASLSMQMQSFFNRMPDYIAPRTFAQSYTSGNQTAQSWRLLQNTGTAWTTGLTARLEWLRAPWEASLWTGYTYGWHQTLHEPLPWIYPWHARVRLVYRRLRHRLALEGFWAAAQKHLSRQIYQEDATPAYHLLHLRYQYVALAQTSHELRLQIAVENVLNTFGWDHLSVGNMPFLGRTFTAGLLYAHQGKSR